VLEKFPVKINVKDNKLTTEQLYKFIIVRNTLERQLPGCLCAPWPRTDALTHTGEDTNGFGAVKLGSFLGL
jgi:hypothetical protein